MYVHFPWCRKKCPYCDFLSIATNPKDIPHSRYASAVLAELDLRVPHPAALPLTSIFFGGGTPSLWDPLELGRVLRGILARFPATPADVEITVECNPTLFTEQSAVALKEAGANRVSLGVQSLNPERLKFLGRWHSPEEGLAAVKAAVSSRMPRVSADLIYGVNQQPASAAVEEVRQIADLGVTHLSAYALTIEPQTVFGALARKGRLPLARESEVADSFLQVSDALGERGFTHYEVSNYARQGHVSEHNLGYWRGRDYLGLGCGAYGTISAGNGIVSADVSEGLDRLRYRNLGNTEKYMTAACSGSPLGSSPTSLQSSIEPISAEISLTEAIMLGLRIGEGIDPEALSQQTGAEFWTPERTRTVSHLVEKGQLSRTAQSLSIPRDQWLLSDAIIRDLM